VNKTRYSAWTVPVDTVEQEALKRGWPGPESELGPGEYIEPDNYSRESIFQELASAQKYVYAFINDGKDYWGQGYVYRERLYRGQDGRPEWRRDYQWTLSDKVDDEREIEYDDID